MARLRYDNSVGTLGASLTSSGTTITFASAPSFATISSPDYIPLVLEPASTSPSANFEIVYLTAYTSGGTTGTISRGQEGTSGVAHSNGVAWAHGPVVLDALPQTSNYAVFTSSGSWTVPAGVTEARVRATGGGGGGAAGVVGASGTAGGGGGSGGTIVDRVVAVTPTHSLTVTVGSGGAAGGQYGGKGGTSSLADGATTLVTANGGERAYNYHSGGVYGGTTGDLVVASGTSTPGSGGAGSGGGYPSGDVMVCVVGGGAGSSCNATNGGTGGSAQQSGVALAGFQASGSSGASGTTSGTNGQTATMPGCGGAGGGAALTGGTAGNGGAGASGQIEIWW